jgi:hypothetical protein
MIEPLMLILILAWLSLAIGVGAVARKRGDSFGWWFFVALMISAPLALLYLIAMPIKKTA